MNPRALVVNAALDAVASKTNALRALEIGCMFSEEEGLSTLHIAAACRRSVGDSRFVSIEYDPDHVKAAEAMLARHDPGLLEQVMLRQGHSLEALPDVLHDMGHVDFALLDGGAHPEVCLCEFEAVIRKLTAHGLIVIDDVQVIRPSPAYSPRREFGKGTLILPYLAIAEYFLTREKFVSANCQFCDGEGGKPISSLLKQSRFVEALRPAAHRLVLIGGGHRMLVVGAEEQLEGFSSAVARRKAEAVQTGEKRLGLLTRLSRAAAEFRKKVDRTTCSVEIV